MEELKKDIAKILVSQEKTEVHLEYMKQDLKEHKEGVIQNRKSIIKLVTSLAFLVGLGVIDKAPILMKLFGINI